jgi:hypothetical protein
MGNGKKIKKGQRYRTRADMEVLFCTSWFAPFTGGGRGNLLAGTVLVIDDDPMPQATGVACVPENYVEVEQYLVPEEDRKAERYSNFYLVLKFERLEEECDLLPA